MFRVLAALTGGALLAGAAPLEARVLHWLSTPQSDLGAVHNDDIRYVTRTSASGRYVAFTSQASNLVDDDANGLVDLFLLDRQTQHVRRVNETSTGGEMCEGTVGAFSRPSSNGRFVAFNAVSSCLPDHIDGEPIAYVKDLQTGALITESVDSGGTVFPVSTSSSISLSADGRYLALETETDLLGVVADQYVYRKDRTAGGYVIASVEPNGDVMSPSPYLAAMSPNGRQVLTYFDAEVSRTPEGNTLRLHVRDLDFATTTLVHVTPTGVPAEGEFARGPAAVADGGEVAFCSFASDLITNDLNGLSDVFLFDGLTNTRITVDAAGGELSDSQCLSGAIDISADAQRIVHVNSTSEMLPDSNGVEQVYLYDGTGNRLLSRAVSGGAADGTAGGASISSDGATVAFAASGNNLTDLPTPVIHTSLYTYLAAADRVDYQVLATRPPAGLLATAFLPVISNEQRYVVYATAAPNAVDPANLDGATGLLLIDRDTGAVQQIGFDIEVAGIGGYDISPSGDFIVFTSTVFHPVTTIELAAPNVFLYARAQDTYLQIGEGDNPRVNNDGNVVFESDAIDLVPDDTNGMTDVFFFDRAQSTLARVSEGPGGLEADGASSQPDIAGVGSATWIAYSSFASNLLTPPAADGLQIFLVNWPNGGTFRISEHADGTPGNGISLSPRLSDNTQVIVFESDSNNLTDDIYPPGFQAFAYDRVADMLDVVSRDRFGNPHVSTFSLPAPTVSGDGRYVTFASGGEDLVLDDDNEALDVFLVDRSDGSTTLLSQTVDGDLQADLALGSFVAVDDSVTPALLGVTMTAAGNLTGLDPAPHHREAFLYQQGGPGVTLQMQVTGDGMVVGNLGYSCAGNCSDTFDLGTTLDLVAVADADATFLGWSGDQCSGPALTCEVLMSADVEIQATFDTSTPADLIFANGFGDGVQ